MEITETKEFMEDSGYLPWCEYQLFAKRNSIPISYDSWVRITQYAVDNLSFYRDCIGKDDLEAIKGSLNSYTSNQRSVILPATLSDHNFIWNNFQEDLKDLSCEFFYFTFELLQSYEDGDVKVLYQFKGGDLVKTRVNNFVDEQ